MEQGALVSWEKSLKSSGGITTSPSGISSYSIGDASVLPQDTD
jgi:hypothetical protein